MLLVECNSWVCDIPQVQGFWKLGPPCLFWLPCIPGSLSELLPSHCHVAAAGCPRTPPASGLSSCWAVFGIPSLACHGSSVDGNIYCVFFYLFYQCKFPRPLLTTFLWLMASFTAGWLRCASSALFLHPRVHEQDTFSLNLLSVSAEKNFEDWGWMPPCFMEAMTVEDLR